MCVFGFWVVLFLSIGVGAVFYVYMCACLGFVCVHVWDLCVCARMYICVFCFVLLVCMNEWAFFDGLLLNCPGEP